MKIRPAFFSVLLAAVSPSLSFADQYNIGVCIAPNDQEYPVIVPDGFGAAIVVWRDSRNGSLDIYAQRITAHGYPLWAVNGVPICTAVDDQYNPLVIPDGSGGAIITWVDHRGGQWFDYNWPINDAYAQHIDVAGQVQWQTNGVLLCDAPYSQNASAMLSDGAGGAIIGWGDERFGPEPQWPQAHAYMQHIDADGQLLWGTSGKSLCDPPCFGALSDMVSDGAGGAILQRGSVVHRIDGSGNQLWTPGGVTFGAGSYAENFAMIADGGGAIIAWDDLRPPYDGYHIHAQRVNASGNMVWDPSAVTVCEAPQGQFYPLPVTDGTGGAIITWLDLRGGQDIYAQRVNAAGIVQWTTNGVSVCTASGDQQVPDITSDNSGGAIIAWNDYRTGNTFYYWDVYAQRINGSGIAQWTPDGIPVSTSENKQWGPKLASDGGTGAIVTWTDRRSGTNNDVYAQHLSGSGQILTGVGGSTPSERLLVGDARPNPFSSEVSIDVTLRQESAVSVEVFDVAGRQLRSMDIGRLHAGPSRLTFDGRGNDARALPSGVYFYRVHAGAETVTKKMVIAR